MKNEDFHHNRIRDPVHGFIHFNRLEESLIDSKEFQRLRNIRQLAMTSLVYPGAMHTRFEHSLGVMELASRAFDLLTTKNKTLLEGSLDEVGLTPLQGKQILRLAALLHDVGHLPFSHAGENVLPKGKKHEDVSIAIIEDRFRGWIDGQLFKGATDLIVQLLNKDATVPPLRLLNQLLSGQLDCDRMDYLLRDSLHCGVGYGNFDYARLLETLTVHEAPEGGLDLAVDRGGIHALEALILARYFMFSQVYCHRTRRIYDIYLELYTQSRYSGMFENLIKVLDYDDVSLLSDLRREDQPETPKKWAARILGRANHSVIFETNDHADAKQARTAHQIFKQLQNDYAGKLDLIIDLKAEGTIHKFYVEGDEVLGEEFMVTLRNRGSSPLTRESRVIRSMPKRFHVVRIYAEGGDEAKEEAKNQAVALHRKMG